MPPITGSGIFYGWWIVSAAFFIALYVSGVIYWGFTAIIQPIASETGWSYTQISLAASMRGLETSLLAPVVGALADRLGPRKLIFFGSFVAAMGLMLLAQSKSLFAFYVAIFIVAIGLSACTTTVLMTAVANCFRRRAGLASGIALCGFGSGGILVSLMVHLIDVYGWRITMEIIGAGMVAIVMPLSLVIRHKPEQYGYVPDGLSERQTVARKKERTTPEMDAGLEVSMNARQAIKSSIFWRIALALLSQTLLTSAAVTHVMPYLGTVGISRRTSGLVAAAIPMVSIAGRISMGWLADRFDKRKVAAGAFTAMSLGMVFFAGTSNSMLWFLIPFLTLFGIGFGGLVSIRIPLLRDYFGRTYFGSIYGLLVGIVMIGTIAGPALAGMAYDHWSYEAIWLVLASLPFGAMISMLSIPTVNRGGGAREETQTKDVAW